MLKRLLACTALGALVLGDITIAHAQELTTLNLIAPSGRGISYYSLVVGEALGYFAEEGVQVNTLPSGTTVPYQVFIANGQADIAILDVPQTYQGVAAGLPIAIVYEQQQMEGSGIAVREESDIQTVLDLEGKSVGLTSDRDNATLRWAMHLVGGDFAKLNTIVVGDQGPTLANALRNNQVAAVAGAFPDWGPIRANGIPIRLITPIELKENPSNVFGVNKDRIPELRDALAGFLRAWTKATYAAEQDHEALARMLQAAAPEEWVDPAWAVEFLPLQIANTAALTDKYGQVQFEKWAALQAPMMLSEVITQEYDVNTFLDGSFIDDANTFDREEVKAEMAAWAAANP